MKAVTLKPIRERIKDLIVYEELMAKRKVTHVILDDHEWDEFVGEGKSSHELLTFGGKTYSIVKEGYWCV